MFFFSFISTNSVTFTLAILGKLSNTINNKEKQYEKSIYRSYVRTCTAHSLQQRPEGN